MEHWERARSSSESRTTPTLAFWRIRLSKTARHGWNSPPPPEPIEPIEALENQGEFPDRFADQGEKSVGPVRRKRKAD